MAQTIKINLNVIPGDALPVIHLSQYDKNLTTLEFHLFGPIEDYAIPNNSSVTIIGTKPDNTGFEYGCTYSGNTATVSVRDQMTVVAGNTPAQLRVTDSSGNLLHTLRFILAVEPSALSDSTIISKTELPLLESAAENASAARTSATAAASSASAAAKSASAAKTSEGNAKTYANNASTAGATAGAAAGRTAGLEAATDAAMNVHVSETRSIPITGWATHVLDGTTYYAYAVTLTNTYKPDHCTVSLAPSGTNKLPTTAEAEAYNRCFATLEGTTLRICAAAVPDVAFSINVTGVTAYLGTVYLGLYDSDVVGVQVDYKNKTYKRLGAASGLNGGSDFDQFPMFGGRKRCNVANDGTINAWYGDSTYKEDGSNGQVMVYQPAFWYLVAPIEYEKQSTGVGYHLRKANYYVSGKARAGFRLHPAFYDANGNEVDHIFFSAFRGSIYDTSAKSYIKDDAQVCDAGTDLFCSISGVKPASGYNQNLTRTSIEQMAQNRGTGWHGDTIKATSASQLLMLIEYAGNLQTAIERGVVDIPWTGLASDNTSSYAVNTGGTSGLGNATGHADSSTQQINGQTLTNTTNGKRSISYRGMEDPWGNMWDSVYGLNFYYESGKPFLGYVCKDFNFAESKQTDNYESIGFTLPSENGYISAMGYSTKFDWLFLPSEVKGDSALPIGDYYYQNNTWNGYRIALLGGSWYDGVYAGGFYWIVDDGVGDRYRHIGGRLVYVPTAKA